jgi:hypothetical protein
MAPAKILPFLFRRKPKARTPTPATGGLQITVTVTKPGDQPPR